MAGVYHICACGDEKRFHKNGIGKCTARGCKCKGFVEEDQVEIPRRRSSKDEYDFRMEFEREEED